MTWPTKKLGELCEIQIGKTPRRGVAKYWQEGTLPWITISEINGGEVNKAEEKITEAAVKELNCRLFPRGTVLYTFKLSIGRVGIADESLFTNEAIAGFFIKNQKEILQKWLYYILPKVDYRPFLSNAAKGNTLNKSALNLLPVPLPPLPTQKQIVERLDKIAEAQKLNDELIKKTDELFQSLLHKELNTPGKNWETKKIGEVCQINPSKAEVNELPGDTKVGFLTMADVSEDAELINIQKRKLREVKKGFTYFKNGDVLFAKITPCMENGKGALVESMENGIGFGSTEFHVLRAKQKLVLNKLLYFIVNDKSFRKNAKKFMRGAVGQQRVPSDYLEKFKISLPDLETQKQIVGKLTAVQEYKKQLLGQKAKLKELFDSVLHKSMNEN